MSYLMFCMHPYFIKPRLYSFSHKLSGHLYAKMLNIFLCALCRGISVLLSVFYVLEFDLLLTAFSRNLVMSFKGHWIGKIKLRIITIVVRLKFYYYSTLDVKCWIGN